MLSLTALLLYLFRSLWLLLPYPRSRARSCTQTRATDLLGNVRGRFSIDISSDLPLTFVHLHKFARYLQPSKRFSLLVESFGTMQLAYKALQFSLKIGHLLPDVYVDTTGYAFTYVVARILFGCQHVWAYVHYPTISTDMLRMVFERRRSAYNHSEYIASSRLTTFVKLLYYLMFAALYGCVGSLATLVMVNSSWTYNHIQRLWKYASLMDRIRIVYPPCNVTDLLKNEEKNNPRRREPAVLSIGQFRPEKDHELQIEAMALLLKRHPDLANRGVKLVMAGSCRGPQDEERLEALKKLTRELNLTQSVIFVVNQPYSVLQEWLGKVSVGIHTVSGSCVAYVFH